MFRLRTFPSLDQTLFDSFVEVKLIYFDAIFVYFNQIVAMLRLWREANLVS